LSEISPEFADFPDALLARSWCRYKLADYQGTLTIVNQLKNNFPEYKNFEEVHFLAGQCYLKLGYYSFAVAEFQTILDNTPESKSFPRIVEQASLELTEKTRTLERLRNRSNNLESQLVATIRISKEDNGNALHAAHRERLQDKRDGLLEELVSLREQIGLLESRIVTLQETLNDVDMEERWRAYSEYGKVRALYLQVAPAN